MTGTPNDVGAKSRLAAFLETLRGLGWIEGKNLEVGVRWARNEPNLIRLHAGELLKSNPDAMLAATSAVVAAIKKETSTHTPIVFVVVSDQRDRALSERSLTQATTLPVSPLWNIHSVPSGDS